MNKITLITNANKGIGFGIAKHLGLSGWQILLGARDEEQGLNAVGELRELGVEVLRWIEIDLGDQDSIVKAATIIYEQYPSLELLINNAGIPGQMEKTRYETDMFSRRDPMEVNYFGTYKLTLGLVPILAQNQGRIVNISEPSKVSSFWHPLAYVCSKSALNRMAIVLAMEFKENDIPVEIFSIHPGPTTTGLIGNMVLPGFHTIDDVGEKIANLINDGKSHNGEFLEVYPKVKEH